jgi:hypothetical protein
MQCLLKKDYLNESGNPSARSEINSIGRVFNGHALLSLQLGTTKINEFVNVVDFYNKYIVPDLQNQDVNAVPVLKASGIKYLVTFRNQVTTQCG